jgi:cell division protein FtsZ
MASGKRASMREGPLADLFRKTDENARDSRRDKPEEARGETSEHQVTKHVPEPQAHEQPELEVRRRERPDLEAMRGEDPVTEPRRRERLPAEPELQRYADERRMEERRRAEEQHAAEARAREDAERRARERRAEVAARRREARGEERHSRYEGLPSPEERLRSVFSSDIPENILDRAPAPLHAPPEPEHTQLPGAPGHHREPVLRVVGVGGAGVNAVNRMIEAEVEGVEFVAVNTDMQSLEQSAARTRVHIGSQATHGLGSGSDPELGRAAALEEYDRLKGLLKGSDMVFITAGAGGGTGTGAAPVVARISREVGALTVGIVTKPFQFEGAKRGDQAERGIEELEREVDTLIVIPNSRLLSVLDKKTSMVDAFRVADDVLRQGVQGVSDLITLPGLINLDFADVRTIMSEAGPALLGIGMGAGDGRTMEAAQHALDSPLLETSIEGARSILLSITGGRDLSLWEVGEAAKAVSEAAHPDANIIFGAMVDEKVEDQVWVTVVATGYGGAPARRSRPSIEADHEPRVRRTQPALNGALDDIDVPEFIPRR